MHGLDPRIEQFLELTGFTPFPRDSFTHGVGPMRRIKFLLNSGVNLG
jgi:hypothetical protein